MTAYRPREISALVREALATFPVVVITGLRQAGKTTLQTYLDHYRLDLPVLSRPDSSLCVARKFLRRRPARRIEAEGTLGPAGGAAVAP